MGVCSSKAKKKDDKDVPPVPKTKPKVDYTGDGKGTNTHSGETTNGTEQATWAVKKPVVTVADNNTSPDTQTQVSSRVSQNLNMDALPTLQDAPEKGQVGSEGAGKLKKKKKRKKERRNEDSDALPPPDKNDPNWGKKTFDSDFLDGKENRIDAKHRYAMDDSLVNKKSKNRRDLEKRRNSFGDGLKKSKKKKRRPNPLSLEEPKRGVESVFRSSTPTPRTDGHQSVKFPGAPLTPTSPPGPAKLAPLGPLKMPPLMGGADLRKKLPVLGTRKAVTP